MNRPIETLFLAYLDEKKNNFTFNLGIMPLLDASKTDGATFTKQELDSIIDNLVEGADSRIRDAFYTGFRLAMSLTVGGAE